MFFIKSWSSLLLKNWILIKQKLSTMHNNYAKYKVFSEIQTLKKCLKKCLKQKFKNYYRSV